MTKKELYNRVKAGAIYGYNVTMNVKYPYIQNVLWSNGDYIFFEHYGRTASKINFKDFSETFDIMFHGMSVNEFTEIFIDYKQVLDGSNIEEMQKRMSSDDFNDFREQSYECYKIFHNSNVMDERSISLFVREGDKNMYAFGSDSIIVFDTGFGDLMSYDNHIGDYIVSIQESNCNGLIDALYAKNYLPAISTYSKVNIKIFKNQTN